MELIKSIISFFQYIGKRLNQSDLEIYIETHKPKSEADIERLIRQFNQKHLFRTFS